MFAEGWEKFKVALASSHSATTSGDTTFRLHFPHHKIYGIVDTHSRYDDLKWYL
jgi:hypothetical protein